MSHLQASILDCCSSTLPECNLQANSIAVSLMPNLQTNETVDCWYTMVVPADQAPQVVQIGTGSCEGTGFATQVILGKRPMQRELLATQK